LVSVNYTLIGANGDSITFDYSSYVLNPGFMGFYIPAAEVRIENSAGDGGVFRHAKRGVRTMDIPLTVIGSNRDDVQTKLRRLGKMTQNAFGPLTLRATYSDGTSLDLKTYYTGGAEGQWGENAGLTYAQWTLSLKAPQPYWQSSIEEQFSISTGSTGRGLLPLLTKMKVSSSSTIGVVTVVNAGDVKAFPIWQITGPVNELVISNGKELFGFESVFSGEIITVNTENGRVTNADGENLYARLDSAPKLFSLAPGTTGLSVLGKDTNLDFNVLLEYSPRYEVVH